MFIFNLYIYSLFINSALFLAKTLNATKCFKSDYGSINSLGYYPTFLSPTSLGLLFIRLILIAIVPCCVRMHVSYHGCLHPGSVIDYSVGGANIVGSRCCR